MQSNIRKIKSHYFNKSALILNKRHLVILILSIFLFNNCRQQIKKPPETAENLVTISENAVNLNTASAAELEKLPRIGEETARKIIEHREKYGQFRRVEHLILVRGISDKKFREMRNLVKIE